MIDFSLSAEQQALVERSVAIFAASWSAERRDDTDASALRFDRQLWTDLADADLLGVGIPLELGGLGMGMTEMALVLREHGRAAALLPLWTTFIAGNAIASLGTPDLQARWLPSIASGEAILSVALESRASAVDAIDDGDVLRVTGAQGAVPFWGVADAVLIPAFTDTGDVAVCVVDPSAAGVAAQVSETTNRELHATLTLDGVEVPKANVLDGRGLPTMLARAQVATSAIVLGAANEALRRTAAYTNQREQFGRTLSSLQAVSQRAANALIDLQCMDATLWRAATNLDAAANYLDLPDDASVSVAKWWAATGGSRGIATAQHLHGAAAADLANPTYRYFLTVKQLQNALGGARQHQALIGARQAAASRPAAD